MATKILYRIVHKQHGFGPWYINSDTYRAYPRGRCFDSKYRFAAHNYKSLKFWIEMLRDEIENPPSDFEVRIYRVKKKFTRSTDKDRLLSEKLFVVKRSKLLGKICLDKLYGKLQNDCQ